MGDVRLCLRGDLVRVLWISKSLQSDYTRTIGTGGRLSAEMTVLSDKNPLTSQQLLVRGCEALPRWRCSLKYYGVAKACNQIRGEDSARDEILLLSNTNSHASQKLPNRGGMRLLVANSLRHHLWISKCVQSDQRRRLGNGGRLSAGIMPLSDHNTRISR